MNQHTIRVPAAEGHYTPSTMGREVKGISQE